MLFAEPLGPLALTIDPRQDLEVILRTWRWKRLPAKPHLSGINKLAIGY